MCIVNSMLVSMVMFFATVPSSASVPQLDDEIVHVLREVATNANSTANRTSYCMGVRVIQYPIGARVTYVKPGGPSDGKLQRGDWIINAIYVSNAKYVSKGIGYRVGFTTLANAIGSCDDAQFYPLVVRNNESSFKSIKMEPCPGYTGDTNATESDESNAEESL